MRGDSRPWMSREMMAPMAADEVWLVRHGETEWSRSGRHTSTTDLPLLPQGEDAARALAPRLAGQAFALVLTFARSSSAQIAPSSDEIAGTDHRAPHQASLVAMRTARTMTRLIASVAAGRFAGTPRFPKRCSSPFRSRTMFAR